MSVPVFLPGRHTVLVTRAALVADTRYGATGRDWPNAVVNVVRGCDVQPVSGSTEDDVSREYANTHLRLFAPGDADIVATDRVTFAGLDYEVDGEPALWRDGPLRHHLTVTLKRLVG